MSTEDWMLCHFLLPREPPRCVHLTQSAVPDFWQDLYKMYPKRDVAMFEFSKLHPQLATGYGDFKSEGENDGATSVGGGSNGMALVVGGDEADDNAAIDVLEYHLEKLGWCRLPVSKRRLWADKMRNGWPVADEAYPLVYKKRSRLYCLHPRSMLTPRSVCAVFPIVKGQLNPEEIHAFARCIEAWTLKLRERYYY